MRIQLRNYNIPFGEFCKHIINFSTRSFQKLIHFRCEFKRRSNVLMLNAISKWLKDEKKIEKYREAKRTGEFFYLNENDVENEVLELFYS